MSLEKQAYDVGVQLGLQQFEKTALLTRLLKPISKGYKGEALVSRIAPLGKRRLLADYGHFLGDLGTGAGVAAALGGDDLAMAGGAGIAGLIGHELNQVRANKYLTQALKGPNALSKADLLKLRGGMGDVHTILGADGIYELLGGISARRRVDEAIKRMK